jgi:hypothetical protein
VEAFKIFKSESRFETADGSDFQEENSNLYRGTSKGLYPSTTPFGQRNIITTVESMISKKNILSISKMRF